MGPQVHPGACSSTSSPWSHSLLWASTCSSVGSSMGCRWVSAPPWTSMGCGWICAPPWTSMGCRETACLTVVFITGYSGVWSISSPSFFPDLGVCRVLTPLSGCKKCPYTFFLLLKYVISEVQPLSLFGLALASSRSVFELASTGSVGHRGSFQQLLTETTLVAPLLPKSCHANPQHQVLARRFRCLCAWPWCDLFIITYNNICIGILYKA